MNVPSHDIPALTALRKLVVHAAIAEEWLTVAQNMPFNEHLYQAGELD